MLDRQDAICLSFKFFYGWTPFVCRCARRGAGARIGRAGAGGGDGVVVLVVASGGAVGEVLDEALFIFPRFAATRRFGSLDAIDAGARPR